MASLLARIGLVRLLGEPLGSVENLPEGGKQAYMLPRWPRVASKPLRTKAGGCPKAGRRPGQ